MCKTKRLEFDTLKEEYADELFKIWSDWDVVKYTYIGNIGNIEECLQRIHNILNKWKNPKDIGPYVIKIDSKVIGFAGGIHKSETLGEYEIFYHFDKAYWGKGYGKESAIELIRQAFEIISTQRVMAEAVVTNKSSWMLLEKIGMKKEGCLRRKFYNGVEFHDLFVYSILRNEWEQAESHI